MPLRFLSNFPRGLGALFAAVSFLLATTLTARANPPASAQVGIAYQSDFAVTGSPKSASSYAITGLPSGLSVVGATFSAGSDTYALNRPFGTITGTPTASGIFSLSVTAWEFANQSGSSRTYAYTITVSPAPASAPVITTQPTPQIVAAGSAVVFTAAASGTPAPTYQWQKDGLDIPGATGNEYSITNCGPADAGSYSLIASNTVGAAISASALLTVIVAPSNAVISIAVESGFD